MRPKGFFLVLFLSFVTLFTASNISFPHPASNQGLKAQITGVKISTDRQPVVTFKISDSKGTPLAIEDLDERGVTFTIATIKVGENGKTSYHNYVLAKVQGKDYVYKGE